MTVPQRKAQIKALEAKLTSAKTNNIVALRIRIIRLKNELAIAERKANFERFLAQ